METAFLLMGIGDAADAVSSGVYHTVLSPAEEARALNLLRKIENNDANGVQLSILNGANPNQAYDGKPGIHIACENILLEAAMSLLQSGAQPYILDSWGNSILHATASSIPRRKQAKDNQKLLVSILLDYGVAVNHQNQKGQTALHVAAENLRVDVVEQLLQAGAQVDVVDKSGNSPLSLATRALQRRIFPGKARDSFVKIQSMVMQHIQEQARASTLKRQQSWSQNQQLVQQRKPEYVAFINTI